MILDPIKHVSKYISRKAWFNRDAYDSNAGNKLTKKDIYIR